MSQYMHSGNANKRDVPMSLHIFHAQTVSPASRQAATNLLDQSSTETRNLTFIKNMPGTEEPVFYCKST